MDYKKNVFALCLILIGCAGEVSVNSKDEASGQGEIQSLLVTGLTDESTPMANKTWSWGCNANFCTYRYTIDSSPTTDPTGSYSQTATATKASGDGTFYIHVQAKDGAENESAVVHAKVLLDNSQPVVSITAPTAGQFVNLSNQSSYTVNGACNEAGGSIQISAGGGSATGTATCDGSQYSSQLNLSGLADGNHSITVDLEDVAGNSAPQGSVAVVKDTTVPTLSVTTPAASSYINAANQTSYTVSGNCNESGGTVQLSAGGVSGTPTCNGSTFSTTLNLSSVAEGAVTLTANLNDAAGNPATAVSVSLTKDSIAPNVAITTPSASGYINNSDKASYTVSGTCNENGRTVSLSADGGSVTGAPTCNGSTFSANLNFTGTSDGAVTIIADMSDTAGNNATQSSVGVTKDIIAPTTPTGFLYSKYSNLTSTPSLTWEPILDAGSGIDYYELAIGTSSAGTNTLTWKNIGSNINYQETGLSLTAGTDYYPSLRAYDRAGNVSGDTNGSLWTAQNPDTQWNNVTLLLNFDETNTIRNRFDLAQITDTTTNLSLASDFRTLSNSSGSDGGMLGLAGMSSGKWYWEFEVTNQNAASNDLTFGIANLSATQYHSTQNTANICSYQPASAPVLGDIFSVLADIGTNTFVVRKNNVVDHTNSSCTITGDAHLSLSVANSEAVKLINGQENLNYDLPTGYSLQNSTANDLSNAHNKITLNGNAAIAAGTVKYGSGAMSFDGTGDYVSMDVGGNPGWRILGNGDFTIEYWAYHNDNPAAGSTGYIGQWAGTDKAWVVYRSGTDLYFYCSADGTTNVNTFGAHGLSQNTWHHFAVTRSGTTLKVFIDGTAITTDPAFSCSFHPSTEDVIIGANGDGLVSYLDGYIDDLRITRGAARYTSNFTPPTATFSQTAP